MLAHLTWEQILSFLIKKTPNSFFSFSKEERKLVFNFSNKAEPFIFVSSRLAPEAKIIVISTI